MRIYGYAVAMLAGLAALTAAPKAAQAADFQIYKDGVCSANAQCFVPLYGVPAGRTVRIDNLSCYLRFDDDSSLAAAQLVLLQKNGARAFAVTPNLFRQDSTKIGAAYQSVFVSNDQIRLVARATQYLRAYAQVYKIDGTVGTILQFSCGISGTIV